MPYEIAEELFEAMKDLPSKDWDDMIELWKNGEAQKLRYEQQYYKQVDNLNLGNQKFRESNRLLTPAEKALEIDEHILAEAKLKQERVANLEQPTTNQKVSRGREELRQAFSEARNDVTQLPAFLRPVSFEQGDKIPNKDMDKEDKDLDRD